MMRMPLLAALLASLLLAPPAGAESAGGTVARGEYLARAGDCVACHSAPGSKAFAGGLKMGTPLGAIFATNITPDIETGIGTYTVQDFDRAVRRGVAKDGRRLYPAMPYPSYAKLTDDSPPGWVAGRRPRSSNSSRPATTGMARPMARCATSSTTARLI
jgi:alcohol dehydrogenase (quinone), cytochrome c subunit